MAATKYGDYIKSLSFQDYGPGSYKQGTKISGDYLGLDVHVEYGTYWSAGRIGEEPLGSEVHDFNEVMIFMGSDTSDLSELGSEVKVSLGEEKETHIFSCSTAIFIPKGLPHLPAEIIRMDKRILFLQISCAGEWKKTSVSSGTKPTEPVGWNSKYGHLVSHLAFARKSAWHYGPENSDDSGGSITDIDCKEFGFNMSYESIRKAPYRFGPRPERPHMHLEYDEFALFLGADTDDLNDLGAELETGMGKEIEMHRITAPTAIKLPKGFPHSPLTIFKLEKPIIFAIIRPFGIVGKTVH